MKRLFTVFAVFLAFAVCMLSACEGGHGTLFLSVRLKGNGDGTITAVAQNEFALGNAQVDATLSLYFSEEYPTDAADMELLASMKLFQKAELTHETQKDGYYRAEIEYFLGGKNGYIQSNILYYNSDGETVIY